jgi:heterodisulfide reductase subunit C
MDTLRQMALQEKVSGKETVIPTFHQTFLKSIRQWGKQYELGMLLELKFRVRDFFSDIGLGIKMLLKGKLSLLPGRVRGYREIRNIFQKSEERKD